MARTIGSSRKRTRSKMSKGHRHKGKINLTRFLQAFAVGQKVLLKAEPSVHKGMYYPKFHGRVGIVKGMVGRCYEITVNDYRKAKTLIVHPVHLRGL